MEISIQNDELLLITPTREYKDKIWNYRQKFLDGNEKPDGSSGLERFSTFDEWFSIILENELTVRSGRVPGTEFIAVRKSDNKMVGMVNVRHCLNDSLKIYGGHIGYSVAPNERKKGYAAAMLKLALKYCKEIKLDKVLLTCSDWNVASRKVIEKCGGVFENEIEVEGVKKLRYWIEIN